MARESGRRRYLAIAALVVVCTASGALGGAVAGGAAGYLLARREVRATASSPGGQSLGDIQRILPAPSNPDLPEVPPMPRGWPFGGPRGEQTSMSAEVATVVVGSPAEAAGLRAGDRITAVDGEELSLGRDLAQALSSYNPGDQVQLSVMRATRDGAAEETVKVTLGENPDDAGRPYLGVTYRMVFGHQVDGPQMVPSSLGL